MSSVDSVDSDDYAPRGLNMTAKDRAMDANNPARTDLQIWLAALQKEVRDALPEIGRAHV